MSLRVDHRQILIIILFLSLLLGLLSLQINFGDNYSSQSYSDEELVKHETYINKLLKFLPSLPIVYWMDSMGIYSTYKYNETCAHLPNVYRLNFRNIYWQTLRHSDGDIQLFRAYYDTRRTFGSKNTVRVLAMIGKMPWNLYCHLWYEGHSQPIISKLYNYKLLVDTVWEAQRPNLLKPYLLTCEVPDLEQVPSCVSIVENPCDNAANLLKIIYEEPAKMKKFAVCVKGLDYYQHDISVVLIEWMEFLILMGVDTVFFYQFHVHPNVTKVLTYYESLGRAVVTPVTLPQGSNLPIFQHLSFTSNSDIYILNAAIHYNDCLYRNLYSFEFIVPLDIDEIIVPLKDKDWTGLMERLVEESRINKKEYSSYGIQSVVFLDNFNPEFTYSMLPPYLHKLQNVYSVKNESLGMKRVEGFIKTDSVDVIYKEQPLDLVINNGFRLEIDSGIAQLQHYQKYCRPGHEAKCGEFEKSAIKDTSIWNYKEMLVNNILRTLKSLAFID